jgi:hypothetical protein
MGNVQRSVDGAGRLTHIFALHDLHTLAWFPRGDDLEFVVNLRDEEDAMTQAQVAAAAAALAAAVAALAEAQAAAAEAETVFAVAEAADAEED